MKPRVKYIILNYYKDNIRGVYTYLNQNNMVIDPSTWAGNIKKLLDNKLYVAAKAEIELVAYKFKFKENEETKNRTIRG